MENWLNDEKNRENLKKKIREKLGIEVDVGQLKEYLSIPVPTMKKAEELSGKIMQGLWQPFLDMYKFTVIQMATPLPPIIDEVSFNYDDNGNVDGLRITFYPSRTEERVKRLRQERKGEYPKIYYAIYRVYGNSLYLVASMESSEFPKDNQGLYYFVDRAAPLGIVRYRMVAMVKWRRKPLKVINFAKDEYYKFVKESVPLPSTTVLLPLMEDVWSAFSDVSIYFYTATSSFSNEYSFYNNPFIKVYARIDVATPPMGEAPYKALVSVTEEGKIYQLKEDGTLSLWADVYFAPPYQKGLAVDWKGWAYTENAASEAKFAGKIFAFVPNGDQGVRLDRSAFKEDFPKPWLGTIRAWSPFGLFNGFIYPVSMSDLCYGMLPGTSLFQEGLFILEQSWYDIRYLPVDGSRQVATPLHRLSESFPSQVPLDEFSRCQYNWEDGGLYFSFADELKRLDLQTHELTTVVSGLTNENKRRFLQIAGFTFGPKGLIYLADAYLQAVYVYLPEKDEALVLYNLQSEQASPVDLDTSADGKYLLVATTKGLLVFPNLLPYKVVAPEGVSLRGILNLKIKDIGTLPVQAMGEYILAHLFKPTTTFYQDEDGRRYILYFDPDTLQVFVRLISPVESQPEEPVEIKEPPLINLTGAINYITVDPEGGAAASCVVPRLPWSGARFIRVLSPWENGTVLPDFYLYAVVSRGISRVKVSLDYQLYQEVEFDPEEGGCLEVPFEDVTPGRHVLLLTAPDAGIVKMVPIFVSSTPQEKVLAGVVVEKETGFPLQGLQVENSISGRKTTVDFYGTFRLVVPQGVEENLIVKSPE